jgi:secreted trypsin-like serine protease
MPLKNHRQTYKLLIGTISRDSDLSNGAVEVMSNVSYVHEKYSGETLQNDIALVKLPEEVTLTGIYFTSFGNENRENHFLSHSLFA